MKSPQRYVWFSVSICVSWLKCSVLQQPLAFSGSGNILTGRGSSSKGKAKEQPAKLQPEKQWGSGGQALGSRSAPSAPRATGAGGASVPVPPRRNAKPRERSPSPEIDFGVDDDDVIEIDSD